jgi:hypothetical protein
MFHQEEIPLYSRPISHSYTQTNIDIDETLETVEYVKTVATVATVTVLDKAGHVQVKVMAGTENINSGEGSMSRDRLLNEGNYKIKFVCTVQGGKSWSLTLGSTKVSKKYMILILIFCHQF